LEEWRDSGLDSVTDLLAVEEWLDLPASAGARAGEGDVSILSLAFLLTVGDGEWPVLLFLGDELIF
jgi:hypothetical protein